MTLYNIKFTKPKGSFKNVPIYAAFRFFKAIKDSG